MNNISHFFLIKRKYELSWTVIFMNEIKCTWMMFTQHKQKRMILQYAYFQHLMRNDRKRTWKYCSWHLMAIITPFLLLFMNGQYWDFLKLCHPANLHYHPVVSHSFSLKWQYHSCLLHWRGNFITIAPLSRQIVL